MVDKPGFSECQARFSDFSKEMTGHINKGEAEKKKVIL